ncbi:zinc finger protein 329-like [Mugil cephalus]|uniref:zinc finger protein 329-like n=1 Tax=Mugil cephalus TaxID=48193 RepID=UPI001FB8106A|nr:zinc finger protein 329-like [Mugil cephalus]
MEDTVLKGSCTDPSSTRLPLSALRLIVPPLRLVSAAIWQTVQQKTVADYGILEEFVSMVTDVIPELLTSRQRTQLILGLRARLILKLCQFEDSAHLEIVQPHLDRIHAGLKAWLMEAGGTDTELRHSSFVDLVKNLLENPDEKEHFFEKDFPEEFGPTYDEALQNLMWLFLSRLEKFLPLPTLQQVASMLGEEPTVLEACMQSVSQFENIKTMLQYQKDLGQLDHSDSFFDGACIISALKLPLVESTKTQAQLLDDTLSCESNWTQIKPDLTKEHQTSETKTDETQQTPRKNGSPLPFEETADLLETEVVEVPYILKDCSVQLQRSDRLVSLHSRPVRSNRGQRMKRILLEEKRGLEDALPGYTSPPRKTKPSRKGHPAASDYKEPNSSVIDDSYMAPIGVCSDNDSWSYYSDEDPSHVTSSSCPSLADSWSNYSDDASFPENDSFSSYSGEEPSSVGSKKALAANKKEGISSIKAATQKKIRDIQCFICKEQLSTSLTAHMKTHFPTNVYACPQCGSRFKQISYLKHHLKRICYEYSQQHVDPEKPDEASDLYKCGICQEAFKYKVSLQKHTLTHNKLYCNVCRKVLRDAATLARHNVSHTPFQCNRCEESFTVFRPLLRHCENVHKIVRPFKCNHCPKTFPRLRFLIMHEWQHTGNLPFQCALCSLRFRSDMDLVYHQRVHTREKPFLCAECGKPFSQKSNLLRHLNLIHGESRNEKMHSCSQCEKSFKEKGALKKHQRSKHLNEVFRNPCPYCGKMISASTMARHKLIHTGERPLKCTVPECDKYFRSTSEVKRHVLVRHSTERPYKCEVCGKGFVKMCYLNTHAKIHSGEKPFVCHICGKAFPKIFSMLRHKKLLHTVITQ